MTETKILVIDDEPDFIEAVRARLEAVGYKIVFACDGRAGFEQALKEKPALILIDLVMSGVNGFEALAKLKADHATSHIPVIVISAKTDAEYVLDAGSLGAVDYITKPVSMQALLEHVKRHL